MTGATLTRQCLQAGLLDEIVRHVALVPLGRGVRLLGGEEAGRTELGRIWLGEAEQLTDLRFRVLKPRAAKERAAGSRGSARPSLGQSPAGLIGKRRTEKRPERH